MNNSVGINYEQFSLDVLTGNIIKREYEITNGYGLNLELQMQDYE